MAKKEQEEKKIKEVKSKKVKATKKEEKKEKESLFHSVKLELSKVKWPSAKEMVKYTLATIVFCVILALFFQGIDLLASFIVELLKKGF